MLLSSVDMKTPIATMANMCHLLLVRIDPQCCRGVAQAVLCARVGRIAVGGQSPVLRLRIAG